MHLSIWYFLRFAINNKKLKFSNLGHWLNDMKNGHGFFEFNDNLLLPCPKNTNNTDETDIVWTEFGKISDNFLNNKNNPNFSVDNLTK